MKHNLIKTDNYLLVVDNEYIKDIRPYIDRWHLEKGIMLYKFPTYLTDLSECKLVLSHAPLNGAPYLDGVDVLPPSWRDSGEEESKTNFAEVFYRLLKNTYPTFEEWPEAIEYRKQSGEKHKYTEEDILDAWELGAKEGAPLTRKKKEDLFDFLHQPKLPIVFECITDFDCCRKYVNCWGCDAPPDIINLRPKTIINSEGRTEWVGKWIFEQPKPNI